jgi:hypothetical protein
MSIKGSLREGELNCLETILGTSMVSENEKATILNKNQGTKEKINK